MQRTIPNHHANPLTASSRAARRPWVVSGFILGACAWVAVLGCSPESRSEGRDTPEVGALGQQLIVTGTGSSGMVSFGSPLSFQVSLPTYPNSAYEDDQYTVRYNVTPSGPDTVLELQSITENRSLGTADVPEENITTPNPPTDIYVIHNIALSGGVHDLELRVMSGPPVTVNQIVLVPLRTSNVADPATGSFASNLLGAPTPSANCGLCHRDQADQWRSSMMGYSSISPPIHSLELTENHVTPADRSNVMAAGRLARDPASPLFEAHAESQLFCQRCHAPIATFTDTFRVFKHFDFANSERGDFPDSHTLLRLIINADDRTATAAADLLREADWDGDPNTTDTTFVDAPPEVRDPIVANALAATEGVTCTVCHRINGIDASNTPPRPAFEPGVANAAFRVVHHGPDEVQTNFGPVDDSDVALLAPHAGGRQMGATEFITGTDGKSRPFIQTGQLCGTCHDVRIPAPDEGLDGVDDGNEEPFRRVENLFTEWRDSPWNNDNVDYDPAASFQGALANRAEPNPLTGMKFVTSCQDCHMSKFVTHDDAKPGEYEMGAITATSTISRQRTNHRFIGVDRFLTHDMPVPGEFSAPDTTELVPYDIALGTAGLVGVDANNSRPVPKAQEFPAGNDNRDLREVLLQKAIDFKIEHVGAVKHDHLPVRISVENVGAGHNIPAGLSQERQVWVELEVLTADDSHVFTSGYLNPIKETPDKFFKPLGNERYADSDCAQPDPLDPSRTLEYECDLDAFRVAGLGPYLNILPGAPLEPGKDTQLVNYQNGFTLDGKKVFTQFIADHIVNDNALGPFKRRVEQYYVPVGHLPPEQRNGPFKINARLRFRPLPFEFLEALHNSAPVGTSRFPSRVTDEVIANNKVIEMEEDHCVVGAHGSLGAPLCNEVVPLALGQAHSCAIFGLDDATGIGRSMQCYGDNLKGQVGIGMGPNEVSAPSVLNVIDVTQAALGVAHSCALHEDGTVSCWGDGKDGKLADGDASEHQRTAPRKVDPALLSGVTSLAAGGYSTCALVAGYKPGHEQVQCWGESKHGELGDGKPHYHAATTPKAIEPWLLKGVESIAAGHRHYCAIAKNSAGEQGAVKCWGEAFGNGKSHDVPVPVEVDGLVYQAQQLAAGDDFSCALLVTGEVNCWGDNSFGTLGNGDASVTESLTPLKVQLSQEAVAIAAGRHHACAVLKDQTAQCWGWGGRGRLGNGNAALLAYHSPVTVMAPGGGGSLTGVKFMAAGEQHTCAVSASGRLCWGRNDLGQLGLGDFTDRSTPAQVTFADPQVTGRTYFAPASKGGPGTAGCTFARNCTDQTQFVDVNADTGFRYKIEAWGGDTDLSFRVSMLTGPRTMEVYVNGDFVQSLTSTPEESPRASGGAEIGPITVELQRGPNTVELRDSGPSEEFDMIYVRVGGPPPQSCSDGIQNQAETDLDCGGPICKACDLGENCVASEDCQSGNCETGICQPGGPCAAYCPDPEPITWGDSYRSGGLGTGAICRETTQPVSGGNCGNFTGGRQLFVNGQERPCDVGNWASVPAPVNDGYCIKVTPGDYPWAFFTLW